MADDAQPAPTSRRAQATAAGGALAGAGLSTGLFGTIGMARIFSGPTGYSVVYPVVVFCLAALFLLTAALVAMQVTREQSLFAYAGMGCFALIVVVGVSVIFWEDLRAPTVTVTEMFDPPDLTSGALKQPKLQLLYRSISHATGDFAPYKNNPLSVRSGDVIAFRMDGLSELLEDDKAVRTQSQTQTKLLVNACKGQTTSFVCQQLAVLNDPNQ